MSRIENESKAQLHKEIRGAPPNTIILTKEQRDILQKALLASSKLINKPTE